MPHVLSLYVVMVELRPVQFKCHAIFQAFEQVIITWFDLGEISRTQDGLIYEILLIPLPDFDFHLAGDHVEAIPFVFVLVLGANPTCLEINAVELQHAIGMY